MRLAPAVAGKYWHSLEQAYGQTGMSAEAPGRTPSAETSRTVGRARRSIAAIVAAGLLALLVLFALSPATRLAVRTGLLFPSFFAGFPDSPLAALQGTPRRTAFDLEPVDGYVRLHVYRLPGGPRPALVLSLGMNPAPPDDPRVVRLMNGLARSGLVAVLVESEALGQDKLFPDLPRALVESVQFVEAQPYVTANHVGLFGFSVGGSLALVAAADPAIRDRLRLVEAFGSFANLQDALLSVATHSLDDEGTVRAWEPDIAAQRHLASALINGLTDEGEQEELRALFVDPIAGATVSAEGLSDEAAAVYALLRTRNRAEGAELLGRLPALVQENFRALSPLPVAPELRAPLYVMYDADDPLLPFTGSKAICAAAKQARLELYCSRFAIFKHVDPTKGGNPLVVSHDLIELFMHAFALLLRLQ
jgi:pimeloyl-ACP methyl ester carboxylesterase